MDKALEAYFACIPDRATVRACVRCAHSQQTVQSLFDVRAPDAQLGGEDMHLERGGRRLIEAVVSPS